MRKTESRKTLSLTLLFLLAVSSFGENGYDLWLRYVSVETSHLSQYQSAATEIVFEGTSETMEAAKNELLAGLEGLLGQAVPDQSAVTSNGAIVAGTPENSPIINGLQLDLDADPESYKIVSTTYSGNSIIAIASSGETGVLYGTFHLLRLIQTGESISGLNINEKPKIKRRLLNHWDNEDRSVERGYAGKSLWKWSELPGKIDDRYKDYARTCASIGINGTVLNNVNCNIGNNKNMLTTSYLQKVKALADVFRPYGVKVYLSALFSAPQVLGGLGTADPTNSSVQQWWKNKCDEIYQLIPDFGGFLVKANSEGQPGPKTYGKTHAQGANCLADAIAPHGGVVIWRAFVYDNEVDADRMKRAYKEFKALDGDFRSNVIIQAKNGPFDFQPREPVHPLFNGLDHTYVGAELQITKEYLGQSIHLVYLAPMWKEILDFDTYRDGEGSTVAKYLESDTLSMIAGVANTGSDMNWCGLHFNQANWYAFGRLAWDYTLSSNKIADEWTKMTWGWTTTIVSTIKKMLAGSHEACVNYTGALGLGGIFAYNHHYGPDPGFNGDPSHPDWNSVYWHKADNQGLGYDRTTSGSNFVSQYFSPNKEMYNNIETCPIEYLCWFHHVPWNYELETGKIFWDELCYRFYDGAYYVSIMDTVQWPSLQSNIDGQRYSEVKAKLDQHLIDAKEWRDVCINYFKQFSNMPVPAYEPPTAVSFRPVKKSKNLNPIHVFDLQGKLISVISPKKDMHLAGHKKMISSRLNQGIYIIRQKGTKPMKIVTGIGY